MRKNHPDVPFERYADDAICHGRSEAQARALRTALEARFSECKLGTASAENQDRVLQGRQSDGQPSGSAVRLPGIYVSSPAVDESSWGVCSSVLLQQSATVQPRRCGIPCALGRLHMHTDLSLADLARRIRPTLVGWIGYYGRFYRSALRRALRPLDQYLVRWGTPKIQTSPNSHHACLGLVARGSVPAALSVRALVSGT